MVGCWFVTSRRVCAEAALLRSTSGPGLKLPVVGYNNGNVGRWWCKASRRPPSESRKRPDEGEGGNAKEQESNVGGRHEESLGGRKEGKNAAKRRSECRSMPGTSCRPRRGDVRARGPGAISSFRGEGRPRGRKEGRNEGTKKKKTKEERNFSGCS